MGSRAQRLPSIFDVGEKLIRHTAEAIALIEGSPAASVPALKPRNYDREDGCDCPLSELEIGGHGHLIDCERKRYRECEGCGLYKPIEEMGTVFRAGTGETYQCETCRGGP